MGSTNEKDNMGIRPKQEFFSILQVATKALELAKQHGSALGGRVSAPFLTQFETNIDSLRQAVPSVITTQAETSQVTSSQHEIVVRGRTLVMSLRASVKGHRPADDVLQAYGVGMKTHLLVREVKAALRLIADRAASHPDEAQKLGIVDEDFAAIKAALAELSRVEEETLSARALAPKTTKQRNIHAQEVLDGIKIISAAGVRAFLNDPTTSAEFEALVKKGK